MRLLALDIDDTLTGRGHEITRPNAEAVAWAMARGVRCTLITGRRYALSAARFADALRLHGPLGVHYGRRVVEHPGGRILTSHAIPPASAKALLDTARRFPEAIISALIGDDFKFERLPAAWDATILVQFSEGDLDKAIAAHPGEVMSLNVSEPNAADAVQAVADAGRRLSDGRLEYYFNTWAGWPRGLITVVSAAADKGTALVEIARHHGVDPSDTVAMGDSLADVPMLRAAGVGVAMPWSAEDVRRAADLVAEGDPEDAVARVIRRLG